MTNEQFNQLVEEHITKMRQVLKGKGDEYAKEGDRLQNFKDGGVLNKETPEEYLFELASKHIIATRDFIHHPDSVTMAQWDEKIGDIINYMLLLKGLRKEASVATR